MEEYIAILFLLISTISVAIIYKQYVLLFLLYPFILTLPKSLFDIDFGLIEKKKKER